jgi:hypothetical protein
MRKTSDPSKKCFDDAVLDSLNTIKEAHVQLRLLTGTTATAALLASQIQLYDLLLDEVSGIHTSLARDLKRTRLALQAFSRPSFECVSRLN